VAPGRFERERPDHRPANRRSSRQPDSAARFSPVARAILANDRRSLPNRPGVSNNLVTGSADKQRAHQGDVRSTPTSRRDQVLRAFLVPAFLHPEPERAALESQLTGTNNSPFLGLAFNWNRTISASSVNEFLFGYTKVKFQTQNTDWAGIGDANATVGIPGGQVIPGLSAFNITGAGGFGSAGIQEFNDIKSYQFSDKYTMFKGRHQLKFGGRWLYQRQGFSYSGNEGILGHFDYSGAFTGFGFADFLLDDVSLKGKGGAVSPFTHLQNRVGVYGQDDFRMRNDLTLNLGLSWEYTSPLVEKDDRQSNIDLQTGQLLLAGQGGNSRALYDAFYGGFEPRLGLAWTPADKWVVRGGFGIVQYMEGTGKNLRLPANPPFNFEGQRSYDKTSGAGSAAAGFQDVTPSTTGGPGTLYRIFAPVVRPKFTKQWNIISVERKRLGRAVGTGRLRGQPFQPHGRAVRLPTSRNPIRARSARGGRSTNGTRPVLWLNHDLDTQTSGTNSIGVGKA
jgi:hypothetical protein